MMSTVPASSGRQMSPTVITESTPPCDSDPLATIPVRPSVDANASSVLPAPNRASRESDAKRRNPPLRRQSQDLHPQERHPRPLAKHDRNPGEAEQDVGEHPDTRTKPLRNRCACFAREPPPPLSPDNVRSARPLNGRRALGTRSLRHPLPHPMSGLLRGSHNSASDFRPLPRNVFSARSARFCQWRAIIST